MFLKLFELRKTVYTSGATRNSFNFYNKLNLQFKYKKLTLFKKWKSGKSAAGRTIFWTRASLLKKNKIYKINYEFRYNSLAIIANFQFISFKNKILSLLIFKNGAVSYFLSTEHHKLFSYLIFNTKKKIKKLKFKSIFLMLFQIKKLSFVCLLELYPGLGAQYCRSPGMSGKIIKLDKTNHTVLIQLPSKIKKIFSFYSFAFLGKIALSEHFKQTTTKAGYWRSFGIKPCVRGVAMNPVDHPHGGRTKAIRHQRTPWGKTTKLK